MSTQAPLTVVEDLKLCRADKYEDKYSTFIRDLGKLKYLHNLQVLTNEKYRGIFVFAVIDVNLPSYGPKDKLDIRKQEEILLYLHPLYPRKAPATMINRPDFPHKNLPHLNLYVFDEFIPKPHLCLHHGNIDEWFLGASVEQYIVRVKKWLEDAAIGELMKDEGFEPMRRLSMFSYLRYDQDAALELVNSSAKAQVIKFFGLNITKVDEPLKDSISGAVDFHKPFTEPSIPCLLIFDKTKAATDLYIGKHINYLGDLSDLIDLRLLQRATSRFLNTLYGNRVRISCFSFIYGIKRPQKVTNTSSDIELLNGMFFVNKCDGAITITGSEPCQMLTHNNVFTPQMASVLSGVNQIYNKSVVVIGCGALGSKISLSLARMGLNKQTIIDSDLLMPHNLARHALYEDYSKDYIFKATAQQKVINQIFDTPGAKSIAKDLQEIDIGTLSQDDYIIDCSASGIVLDYLSSYKLEISRVIRCELALNGQLGFVFICNKEQNPSLSDMRLQLIYTAVSHKKISQWLRESAQNKSDFAHQEFSIGFGCSSDTMILDDATINVHAGISAAIIKNLSETDEAKIIISIFNCENFSENATHEIPCEKLETHTVGDWVVKITDKKEAELKNMAKARAETGGILIGNIDKRKKVIIIMDYFIPEDNQESVGGLVRGSKGIKEYVDNLVKNTAGVISYVGEWHTHPRNSTGRSTTDTQTFTYLVSELGKIELPALMGIFNESSVSYFVQEHLP